MKTTEAIASTFKQIIAGALMAGSFLSSSAHSDEAKSDPKPIVIIMLGPPGAGKGTQAAMVHEKLQIPHISTGELLRDHVRRETALGKEAKLFMDKGNLVPDHLILDMLFERVALPDCAKGYILDGFPRTLPQAESLQARLKGRLQPIVLNLDLADSKIIERLTKRVVCESCGSTYHLVYSPPKESGTCDKCSGKLVQRSDDTEAVITKRLKVYHDQTSPLIAYYNQLKLLHTIDCDQSKERIFSEVLARIPQPQK
jgi:adenylate kinase